MRGEGADAQERRHRGQGNADLLGDDQDRQDHDGVLLEDLKAVGRGSCLLLVGRDGPAADALGMDNRSRGIHGA